MKVGLIAPPTLQRSDLVEPGASGDRALANHLPLGILTLAAILRERGLYVHFADLNTLFRDFITSTNADGFPNFCSYAVYALASVPVDVLAFGTICSSFPLTLRIASCLREQKGFGRVPVILGGPQASVVDEPVLEHFPSIGYIVRGEAEDSFPALLEALASPTQTGLERIPGISFRRGSSIIRTAAPPARENLDQLPFPAYELFPHIRSAKTMPVELGRGCPYGCTFCSTNDFFRRRYRLRSPEITLSHMRRVRDEYGVTQFALVHDMFTVDQRRVVQFCDVMAAANEPFYWHCSARTDRVDEGLLDIMQRSGCRGVFFGVETGSPELQQTIKKRLDLNQAQSAILGVSSRGMAAVVSLIMGFPTETKEDLRGTIDVFLRSLRWENVNPQLHLLSPLAGTPIHRDYATRLQFDGANSDISEAALDDEDWTLVKRHRDIFPNFYAVPSILSREFLVEVREFILEALRGWRLFLVGLHRCDNVLEIVRDLLAWRARRDGRFGAAGSRADEIVAYLRSRYAHSPKLPVVTALADIWRGVNCVQVRNSASTLVASDAQGSDAPDWASIPRPGVSVVFVELGVTFRSLKEWILHNEDLESIEQGEQTLAIQVNGGEASIREVSGLARDLLKRCDGHATVREIAHSVSLPDAVGSPEAVRIALGFLAQRGYITLGER